MVEIVFFFFLPFLTLMENKKYKLEISNIYFLLNYNRFSSEFHFVLRLLVRSANFTLDYANTSTSLHNDLKARATSQVGFRRNNHDVEVFRFCQ